MRYEIDIFLDNENSKASGIFEKMIMIEVISIYAIAATLFVIGFFLE